MAASLEPLLPSAPSKKRPYLVGWRFGVIGGSLSIFIVLVLNLSFMLWTLSRGHVKNNRGQVERGILFDGNCDKVRSLNIAAHLIINIFSTVILASSNYCMQCLSAPTRADIDKSHAQGKWLDVGVLSMRNLRCISRKRTLVWTLLGISSLPLHLFYNSVIFASTSANGYRALYVNSAFLNATSFDDVRSYGLNVNNSLFIDINIRKSAESLYSQAQSSSLQRLNNSDCIQAYAHDYLSDRSNMLLVSDFDNSTTGPYVFDQSQGTVAHPDEVPTGCAIDPYSWICPPHACSDPCQSHIKEVLANYSHWTPNDIKVKYCLSQQTPEHCKLQFSFQIVIVVIVINAVKMMLMLYVVFGLNETPLMTIGDAIASFLKSEDPTTKSCCLISKFDIKVNKLRWQYREGEFDRPPAKAWLPIKEPWARAVSRTRWWACGLMILSAITVCAVLLGWGISAIVGPKDIGTLWRLGLGAVSVRTLISWKRTGGEPSLVTAVLIANLAQPILSFIYFIYNGIFTCMLGEREWNQFAGKKKGLRVSSKASGSQRSSYFLQLPYRFGIPIMLLSGVLHWLVSQSIFLVAIEIYGADDDFNGTSGRKPDILTCGYSPIAIMFVIILAAVMMIIIVGTGRKRYEPGIPIAGNCSAVLSAACHVETDDKTEIRSEMALKPLQWGATTRPGGEDIVGHCSFSAAEVTFPEEFALYAGKS